jgi:hypothetical protein
MAANNSRQLLTINYTAYYGAMILMFLPNIYGLITNIIEFRLIPVINNVLVFIIVLLSVLLVSLKKISTVTGLGLGLLGLTYTFMAEIPLSVGLEIFPVKVQMSTLMSVGFVTLMGFAVSRLWAVATGSVSLGITVGYTLLYGDATLQGLLPALVIPYILLMAVVYYYRVKIISLITDLDRSDRLIQKDARRLEKQENKSPDTTKSVSA